MANPGKWCNKPAIAVIRHIEEDDGTTIDVDIWLCADHMAEHLYHASEEGTEVEVRSQKGKCLGRLSENGRIETTPEGERQ